MNPLYFVPHTRAQALSHHCRRCWQLLFQLLYRLTLHNPAPPTLTLLTIRNPSPDLPGPPIRIIQRSQGHTYRRIAIGSGSHLHCYTPTRYALNSSWGEPLCTTHYCTSCRMLLRSVNTESLSMQIMPGDHNVYTQPNM